MRVRRGGRVVIDHRQKVIPNAWPTQQSQTAWPRLGRAARRTHFLDAQQTVPPNSLVRLGVGRSQPPGQDGEIHGEGANLRVVVTQCARPRVEPLRRGGFRPRRQRSDPNQVVAWRQPHAVRPGDPSRVAWQQITESGIQFALGQADGQPGHPVAVVVEHSLRLAKRRLRLDQHVEVAVAVEVGERDGRRIARSRRLGRPARPSDGESHPGCNASGEKNNLPATDQMLGLANKGNQGWVALMVIRFQ